MWAKLAHEATWQLESLLAQGGPIFALILLLSVAMWTLIIERYWYLYRVHPLHLQRCVRNWRARSDRISWRARQIRSGLIADLTIPLADGLALIRALVMVLPLLGLLGTVSGMVTLFDVIAVFGMGNIRGFASGIDQALLSTAAGLVTALSGFYFSAHLRYRVRMEAERAADLMALESEGGDP
jgi:biopolymer transport protein ExbB